MKAIQTKTVCPVEGAGALDVRIRKWFHNPEKILRPYIASGMSVLDLGCGPGFFTVGIASLLNGAGRVVAADLQAGMLDRVRAKIEKGGLSDVVWLHKCGEESIGLDEKFDFILAFWMLHEIPDQRRVLREFETLLAPGGKILIVEPKGHVSPKAFDETEKLFVESGFRVVERPEVRFSRSILLVK